MKVQKIFFGRKAAFENTTIILHAGVMDQFGIIKWTEYSDKVWKSEKTSKKRLREHRDINAFLGPETDFNQ